MAAPIQWCTVAAIYGHRVCNAPEYARGLHTHGRSSRLQYSGQGYSLWGAVPHHPPVALPLVQHRVQRADQGERKARAGVSC